MKFEDIVVPATQTIQFEGKHKLPYDVMINGFSIKETVREVLAPHMSAELCEKLSEEMKEVFATKMKLRQHL